MFEAQPHSCYWLLTVTVHQGSCRTLQSRNLHSPPVSFKNCFKNIQTQYLQRNWMSLEKLERNLMQSLRLVPCAELGYKMLGILPSLTCCTCSELMTSVQLQCHQVERWMQTLRTSELFSGPSLWQSGGKIGHIRPDSSVSMTQAREDVGWSQSRNLVSQFKTEVALSCFVWLNNEKKIPNWDSRYNSTSFDVFEWVFFFKKVNSIVSIGIQHKIWVEYNIRTYP